MGLLLMVLKAGQLRTGLLVTMMGAKKNAAVPPQDCLLSIRHHRPTCFHRLQRIQIFEFHHFTTSPLHHFTTSPLHHFTTSPLHHFTTLSNKERSTPSAIKKEPIDLDILD
jgi:hypothetical protein